MSELLTAPERSLVIYHFMFGKKQTKACPMCTAWIDAFNGVAHHLAQNVDLAIVAAADPSTLRAYARNRGWDRLRLLSAGDSGAGADSPIRVDSCDRYSRAAETLGPGFAAGRFV